jgi:uncharacterized protein YbjT (DUF2867 family)
MTILVAGSTGEVGGQVVRALRERGADVRKLVRPQADLADRASIDRMLEGCDAAFFITPHHVDEERLGHNFIDACEAAGIRRLVYVSAYHPLSKNRIVQRLFDGLVGMIGAHYRPKIRVERRVRNSRLSPVVLCPSNFYQNDELCLPEILAGHYPQALGTKRANRVDTRDIGDAAARALLDDLPSGSYQIVGPDQWTAAQCADVWSETLGREVRYAPQQWSTSVAARLPLAKAHDFEKTFRVIQRYGIPATAATVERTTALLGRPPRSYRDYVSEVAKRERDTVANPLVEGDHGSTVARAVARSVGVSG